MLKRACRWVSLKKIHWQDQEGKKRVWEAAERKTRGSSAVDGTFLHTHPTCAR
jgi:hypothetical protein